MVRLSCQKVAKHAETMQKDAREKSNDEYSLSIRVHTTLNHISIYFFYHIKDKAILFSKRELKKVLRNTLTRAARYGLLPTTAN